MKLLPLALVALVALVAAGCNGILPTQPTAYNPADYAPIVQAAPAPPPPGPHFAMEMSGPTSIDTSQPWSGMISIFASQTILRPELPARVITTCGATTQTHPLGSGSSRVSCALPLGTHQILAIAEMADGRRYPGGFTVTVTRQVLPPLEVFYTLVDSHAGQGNTVGFSVRTVDGARTYRWDFGDGGTETTMLPYTTHLYGSGSRERRVTATAVDSDGLVMTTGSVVGRW